MNKCLMRVFRFVIVIINLIFLILGLVLLSVGIVARFYPDNPLVVNYEGVIKDEMKEFLEATGDDTTKLDDFHVTDIVGDVAIAMIVSGALIFTICFVAIGGAACRVKMYLLVYAIVLILLVVAQLLAVLLVYTNSAITIDRIKSMLLDNLREKYEGYAGLSITSIGWNFMMSKFSCCGVNDYMDFESATSWQKTKTVNSVTYSLAMPVYCCSALPTDGNLTCATTISGNSGTGCFQEVWDELFGRADIMVFALIGGFGIQICIIVMSIVIYIGTKKNKVGDSKTELLEKQKKTEKTVPEQKRKMANFSFNIQAEVAKKEKEKAKAEKEAKEQEDWD